MNGLQDFQGDALLVETLDGGDLPIENGLFISDKQFSTAVYISLFGGNEDDAGSVESKHEFWGNFLKDTTENEKLRSRFQHIINGLPMTVKNIKEAESAAAMDLQWFIGEKIADKIVTYGQAVGKNRFKLKIEILKDKETLFENEYFLLWGGDHGDSV